MSSIDATDGASPATTERVTIRLADHAAAATADLVADGLFVSRSDVIREGIRRVVTDDARPDLPESECRDSRITVRLPHRLVADLETLVDAGTYPSRQVAIRAGAYAGIGAYTEVSDR